MGWRKSFAPKHLLTLFRPETLGSCGGERFERSLHRFRNRMGNVRVLRLWSVSRAAKAEGCEQLTGTGYFLDQRRRDWITRTSKKLPVPISGPPTKSFHPRRSLAGRIGRGSSGFGRIYRIGVRLASAACDVAPSIRGDPNKSVLIRVLIVGHVPAYRFCSLTTCSPSQKSRATSPGCDSA